MKMKEYSLAYNKEAISLAMSKITIQQCKDCGHPTEDGFTCWNCESTSPKHPDQEPSDSMLIQGM